MIILFLAGMGLCITKHPIWGSLCLLLAVLSLIMEGEE